MSQQAFTLAGLERIDGIDYAQSWLIVQFGQRSAENDGAVFGEELRCADVASEVLVAEFLDPDVADLRRAVDDVAPWNDATSIT